MSVCKECGCELPKGSRYCSKCGGAVGEGSPSAKEKSCPKCGIVMRAGFMVERDSPLSLYTYGAGIYWTPGEAGLAGERVGVKAYACPDCGYIEQYVRRLEKDRVIIMSAPKTHEEGTAES